MQIPFKTGSTALDEEHRIKTHAGMCIAVDLDNAQAPLVYTDFLMKNFHFVHGSTTTKLNL